MVVEQLPHVSLLNLMSYVAMKSPFISMQWLRDYGSKIASLGVFDGKVPNHVLVNEYTPGQGIMVRLECHLGPRFPLCGSLWH